MSERAPIREIPTTDQKKLESIGLSLEAIRGEHVRILDIHEGVPTFSQEDAAFYGVGFLTFFDPWDESVDGDELPFKAETEDKQFSLVTVTHGFMRRDIDEEVVSDFYKEAMRVLRPNGELRIYDPLQGHTTQGDSEEADLATYFAREGIAASVRLVQPEESGLEKPYLVVTKGERQVSSTSSDS